MALSPLLRTVLEPFEKYLKTKDLVEISINRPGEIWLETFDGWSVKKDAALSMKFLNQFARALATASGQDYGESVPMLACRLPHYGFRVQIVGGTTVESGFAMSIRCGTARIFELTNYMSESDAREFKKAIEEGKTILASGGTGTGKTTFINSVIPHIPRWQRIITIEDTPELSVPHENCTRFVKSKTGTGVANVSYQDLINATLRLRPDRILVGELTTDNTFAFLRVINTGHSGCLSTVHADSPAKAFAAMVQNVQLHGTGGGGTPPADVIERYARQGISYIAQLTRKPGRKFEAHIECVEDC